MTREDAIKTLKELWRETNDTWYEEVYEMAINALEADHMTENCSEIPNNCDDEPQTNADQHVQHVGSVESTWTKEDHEAFYTFLWNVINPNEMQDYIGMFESKDEPQTERSFE